jgi:hypothetical protein
MGDTRNATVGVNPRGSEGEDFSSSHASPQADDPGQRYFLTLGEWGYTCPETEVTKEVFDLHRTDPALASGVFSRRTEPAERAVPAPLPLVPSDGEDVGQEVGVALNAALADDLEARISPLGERIRAYLCEVEGGELGEVSKESVDALYLECPSALPRADLIPVSNKSFAERLSGYRPTLHRQNLGLLRGGPSVAGSLGLEGARLANSVPRDLESPPVFDLTNMRHARNVRRNLGGKNRD